MKPLGFYGNLPLAQTPIRASNTNNTRQTFTPCLEHHDFMPWCMQVRQNEFEIPYIVRQNPCTFAPCVCRPSSVWVRPALCRRNANTKVFPSARLENSVQAIVLGRREVCLTPVRASSNPTINLKSTMQHNSSNTAFNSTFKLKRQQFQLNHNQSTSILNKTNKLQLPTQPTTNDFWFSFLRISLNSFDLKGGV